MACGILVPWPGSKPVPSAIEARSLNHWTAREIPKFHSFYAWIIFHLCVGVCVYTHHIFFICWGTDHLLLPMVIHVAILGCMYLLELVLFSSDMYHGMTFLDLYCSSFFSFLRGLHLVFHNGCTNLHSYKQFLHRKKDFSPHSHQHLLFVVSLIITILTDVRGYLFDLHFSY